ncbi:MAG: alpha/beta hydrolase family protein [Sphingobium sp.]
MIPASCPAQTPSKAEAPPPVIPLEIFAKLPFIEMPTLSPGGQRIAAQLANNGKQMLAIKTADEKPVLIATGKAELRDLTWLNDDWLLATIGQSTSWHGLPVYATRTIAVSADGKTVRTIPNVPQGQHGSDILWVARDGSPRVILAFQKSIVMDQYFWPTVAEIDVATNKMKTLIAPRFNIMEYFADSEGVIRAARHYDDQRRRSRLLVRATNDDKFVETSRADRRRDERLTIPKIFTADPAKAIVTSQKNGFNAVYEYDLTRMELGEKLFSAPGYDIIDLITSSDGKQLTGVRYIDTQRRVRWFDPDLAKIQANIDKAVGPDRTADIVSMNRNHDILLVRVGSSTEPGRYYFYNIASGLMTLYAKVNADIPANIGASTKTIHYKSRDGVDIQAVLTLPRGRDAGNLPLILLPHGGPSTRDYEQWDWMTQFLANRGYAVLQPNYRGSSGFGKAFSDLGDGQWGLKMQDDLIDAVGWAVKQGLADTKRVCIMGISYGGYAAMRGAQRDGTTYRCAISYAGVSDLGGMARYGDRFLYSNSYKDNLKEEAPDFTSVSPINFATDFTVPILLMHGAKDLRVPVHQSRQMAQKLESAGKTVRYVEQKEADHHFTREADRIEFLKEVETFLNRYNPA